MREGWELKRLDELILITHGYAFKSKDFKVDYYGDNPIVLTPGNYSEDSILYFTEKNTKRCHNTYPPKYLFNTGDLTVVMTDLSSKMKILGKPAIITSKNILHNQRIGRIIFKSNALDTRFLYHFFNSDSYLINVKSTATGTMVRHTSPSRILSNLIPVPSVKEQKQIVAILDKAFAAIDQAIANTEKNTKNAKDLFQSKLNAIFSQTGEGWEEKKLGDITTIITKGASPKWQGVNYIDKPGILFITSENVGSGDMLMKKRKYLESKFNSIQKRSILKIGDVLTNIVGASIGRTAIYNLNEIANINQAVCILRCNDNLLNNEYLMNLLNSPYLKSILHANEINNARANLSLTFFKNLTISLPNLQQQKKVVDYISKFKKEFIMLESVLFKRSKNLEELKKSILQKAFSGELTRKVGLPTSSV